MTEKIEDHPQPNSFLAVLQRKELKDGILSEASEQLGVAALAAKMTKKKATVTLTLIVEPQKGGAIAIGATVGAKVPPTREDSLTIYFVDEHGGLHRDDPEQKEFKMTLHEGGAEAVGETSKEQAS